MALQTRVDHLERVVGVVAAERKRGPQLENVAVGAHETHQDTCPLDRGDDVLHLHLVDPPRASRWGLT